jgi:hypothetical protein
LFSVLVSLRLTCFSGSIIFVQYCDHIKLLWLFQLAFANWSGTVSFVYTSQVCLSFWTGHNHPFDTRYYPTKSCSQNFLWIMHGLPCWYSMGCSFKGIYLLNFLLCSE